LFSKEKVLKASKIFIIFIAIVFKIKDFVGIGIKELPIATIN